MINHELVGIVAGVLSFIAYPIYIKDILAGNTKPSRVTWWVLALLNAVLVAAYYGSGARDTIWIPVSYAFGFTVIALLSLKYGEGGWERTDSVALIGAGISLLLWWLLQSAEIALFLIILTDFIGLLPTIVKSFKRPWTESRFSWGVAFVASALNILAIEKWTLPVSSYPIYVAITNGLITLFIFFPFRKERPEAASYDPVVPNV